MDISFDTYRTFVEEQMPHVREIGARLLDISHNGVRIRVPFQEKFLVDVEKGVVHGGLITIMLDTVCGASVYLETRTFEPIATLDFASLYPSIMMAHNLCYTTYVPD